MNFPALTLETSICPDGVDIKDFGERVDTPAPETVLSGIAPPTHGKRLVYRSARRQPLIYKQIDLSNPLCVKYGNVRTAQELADFYHKYGPRRAGLENPTGLSVDEELHALAEYSMYFDFALSGVPERVVFGLKELEKAVLRPSFEYNPGSITPIINLKTDSLTSYMAMEIAIAASTGVKQGRCEHCYRAFLTGYGTSNRSSAKYCSIKCKSAASRKRALADEDQRGAP